nr:MAG TPA: hypothetical protein [Caudoviricetes sp.]
MFAILKVQSIKRKDYQNDNLAKLRHTTATTHSQFHCYT